MIYEKFAGRHGGSTKVAAHYALSTLFKPYPDRVAMYCYTATKEDFQVNEAGRSNGRWTGARHFRNHSGIRVFSFGALYIGDHMMNAGVRPYPARRNTASSSTTCGSVQPGRLHGNDSHAGQPFRGIDVLAEIHFP